MKQIIALILLLVAVILVAAWATNPNSINRLLPKQFQVPDKVLFIATPKPLPEEKLVRVKNTEFIVEIARTAQERSKGLSDRESLPDGHGMFFVFDKMDVRPSFWMKDTNFSLDLIWINDNKVTQITENIQPVASATTDDKIPLYLPHSGIDFVLEVPGGTVEKNKIIVGDDVYTTYKPN